MHQQTRSGIHSQTAGSQARKRQQNDNILLPLFPPLVC
ncbi:unknown [Prevotella sp. CAG:891]|nr:unknown [Prevotella sp. CAG:891]